MSLPLVRSWRYIYLVLLLLVDVSDMIISPIANLSRLYGLGIFFFLFYCLPNNINCRPSAFFYNYYLLGAVRSGWDSAWI
jgi:hypothetical protein